MQHGLVVILFRFLNMLFAALEQFWVKFPELATNKLHETEKSKQEVFYGVVIKHQQDSAIILMLYWNTLMVNTLVFEY